MNVEIFKKENFEVRVAIDETGEPLFCLNDVCKTLDILDPKQVRDTINAEFEKEGVFYTYPFETAGGTQNFTMITESELYFVLMRSNKPSAKEFRKWVNVEVLPSIRKHGAYLTQKKIDDVLSDPDTIIALAQNLKAERARRAELEAQAKANSAYVSFAKSVEASVDSVLIGNYAKLLSDSEGVKIGQNNLFDYLRASGYLIASGTRRNVPYQKFIDAGYFEVTTQTFAGSTGTHQKFTTKITGKGQIALAAKIVEAFKKGA